MMSLDDGAGAAARRRRDLAATTTTTTVPRPGRRRASPLACRAGLYVATRPIDSSQKRELKVAS